MKEITYSSDEVLLMTGIRKHQLDYLVRTKQIPVILKGRAIPRVYTPESIDSILYLLDQRGLETK